jgi:hypothetical protein
LAGLRLGAPARRRGPLILPGTAGSPQHHPDKREHPGEQVINLVRRGQRFLSDFGMSDTEAVADACELHGLARERLAKGRARSRNSIQQRISLLTLVGARFEGFQSLERVPKLFQRILTVFRLRR